MSNWRGLLLAIPVIVASAALPLAALVLTPAWTLQNCDWHGRCSEIGDRTAEQHVVNMRNYFVYQEELKGFWSDKERRHLAEVRTLYAWTALATIAACTIVGLALWHSPATVVQGIAASAVLLILVALVSLPGFAFVWREWFHPLLFDNRDWLTTPRDMTWYITPRAFFRNSLIAIVGAAALLLAALFAICRWRQQCLTNA